MVEATVLPAPATETTPAEVVSRRDATLWEIATIIAASRDFPDVRTPEKAMVRIMAGAEMGIGPIASVIGIRIQAGRVSIDAGLMASRIKNSGRYDYKIITHTNEACVLEFFENSTTLGQSSFTLADAEKAGLHKKDTWKNFPRNMLFARALSNGARWYCAGIFGGAVYTHEELGLAVDDEGHAIEPDNAGLELCTKDQRTQIYSLVAAIGNTMEKYCEGLGIKLLDELTVQEADKEIKKLEKKAAKAGAPQAMQGTVTVSPSAATTAADNLTPAQATVKEALDDSLRHSTPDQRDKILQLARDLIHDEDECCEAVKAWLAKRNCKRLQNLNYLHAEALIEGLLAKLVERDPNYVPF